ncbi:MAG TPA: BF3164 family lipoprotein [Longimicrobiales bacterium]|nr:BF3164 family lipoprotein [Longimicrobiales bacterium]
MVRRATRIATLSFILLHSACGESGSDADGQANNVGQSESFSGAVPHIAPGTAPDTVLKPRRLIGDSLTFGFIDRVGLVGQHLAVLDTRSEPHLTVVDLQASQVVNRLIQNGDGPGEMRQPNWIQTASADPPQAWIYDFGTRRFTLVDLLAQPDQAVLDQVRLSAEYSLLQPNWFAGRIVSNGLFVDNGLLVLDRQGGPVQAIDVPPPFDSSDAPLPVARRLLNRSYLAVNPSGTRMAAVYQFGNRIDFHLTSGTRYGSVSGPRETTPRYSISNGRFAWEEGNEMAYAGVAATERYVYALFTGDIHGAREQNNSRLHVFTWEGDFVKEIDLGFPTSDVAVSSDDGLVYAGISIPHPIVAEWSLREVL